MHTVLNILTAVLTIVSFLRNDYCRTPFALQKAQYTYYIVVALAQHQMQKSSGFPSPVRSSAAEPDFLSAGAPSSLASSVCPSLSR
jgi:hypothetical protein